MIEFRVKKLTETAKLPTRENEGGLWDLYADGFCADSNGEMTIINTFIKQIKAIRFEEDEDVDRIDTINYSQLNHKECEEGVILYPQGRILVKTGISLEFPKKYKVSVTRTSSLAEKWFFKDPKSLDIGFFNLEAYAVAEIQPRSDLAIKHGLIVLNTQIENDYKEEIGVILYNAGHKPYTIIKGDKIAKMLIKPIYPSVCKEIE
jgi:dUTPase